MPYVGNLTTVRDKESCYEDYQVVQETAKYNNSSSLQNAWTAMNAEAYVSQLLHEAPRDEFMKVVANQLAVVTGVTTNSVAYHVAQELALQVGMHVVLLARSEGQLKRCASDIRHEAKQRGLVDQHGNPIPIILYECKFHLASLESVRQAADYVTTLSQEKYQGKLHILINHASVGSLHAKLTINKMEYNTGCNFVATHYFTKLLIPLLQKAIVPCKYKPRVIFTSSMGHALGTNFDPHLLTQHPMQGGAPPGYIIEVDENTICEYEPPPPLPDEPDDAPTMSWPIMSSISTTTTTMAISSLFQKAKTAITHSTQMSNYDVVTPVVAETTRTNLVATTSEGAETTPPERRCKTEHAENTSTNTIRKQQEDEPPSPTLSLVIDPDHDDAKDNKEQPVQHADDGCSSNSSSTISLSPIAAHDAAAAANTTTMSMMMYTMARDFYQMTKDVIVTHQLNAATAAANKAAIATGAGTQVGRSKMALVADAVYFAHLYPEINFTSHHPGAIFQTNTSTTLSSSLLPLVSVVSEIYNQGILYLVRLSPSQGARAALRAALDPDFNNNNLVDLQDGAYLHADGNPWTCMLPSASVLNPETRQPYRDMLEFGKACHEAADALIDQIFLSKKELQDPITDVTATASSAPLPSAAVNVNQDQDEMEQTTAKSTTCST